MVHDVGHLIALLFLFLFCLCVISWKLVIPLFEQGSLIEREQRKKNTNALTNIEIFWGSQGKKIIC